jgi:hypothetical protein
MNPKYPIYIISKGRWESRLTSNALEESNIPYRIVVEPDEYDNYAAVIDSSKILCLPFSNLGQGSIPARNFVWEHSINEGHERHWILDDNIEGFYRYNYSIKYRVVTGTIFKCAEDFIERYENIALAGFQYKFFATHCRNRPAFILNTRIYSCILIKNDLPYRWRGRYNEDTDLSLRALKDGWCTILFNAFLQGKAATMTMSGGNTDNVYTDNDERMKFAKSLEEQHPNLVKVVRKFNRWHHQVNYGHFKNNKLVKKQGIEIPNRVNEYGMVLKNVEIKNVQPKNDMQCGVGKNNI